MYGGGQLPPYVCVDKDNKSGSNYQSSSEEAVKTLGRAHSDWRCHGDKPTSQQVCIYQDIKNAQKCTCKSLFEFLLASVILCVCQCVCVCACLYFLPSNTRERDFSGINLRIISGALMVLVLHRLPCQQDQACQGLQLADVLEHSYCFIIKINMCMCVCAHT